METLIKTVWNFGVTLYDLNHKYQGIVHMRRASITLPGMTIVIPLRLTARLVHRQFGIGTSEVEHGIATIQTPNGQPKP